MNVEIEKTIEILAKKVTSDTKPDEALKYTQSVLNLTHAMATLSNIKEN